MTVPLRAAPVFAATLTVTLPLPVPLAPLVIVSQPAFDVAVQAQVDADAVTAIVPLPASAPMFALAGAIVNVHGAGAAAAWLTVKVRPAIEIVPLRALPVFAAALTVTLPLPVPLAPLVIVNHAAFDVAVHEQFAVTLIVAVPTSAVRFAEDGEIEKLQVGVAAAWLTVKVWPPIVTVPVRAGSGLSAAETVTVPLPVPLAPLVTVSHGAFEAAVHAHDGADAVTVIVPVPPSAVTVAVVGEIVKLHGGGGGGGGGVAVCDTVTLRPAIVSVAERSAPLFAATVTVTVVSPLPLAALSVAHGALLDAVQPQLPCAASMRTVLLPPDAPKVNADGVTVNVHGNAS